MLLLVSLLEDVVEEGVDAAVAAAEGDVMVAAVEEVVLDTLEENSPLPDKNETARLINGKAYAACKECGWNRGPTAHTTGACGLSMQRGYTSSYAVVTAMKAVRADEDEDEEKVPTKKSGDSTKVEVMTAMLRQCETMEKEEDDPDQANFAGMMGAFMKSMMKSKKE